jgi:transcriptional regulator with XRE-family HTH domain
MSEMNFALLPRAPFLKPVATQSRNDALFRLNQSRLATLGDACAPSSDPCGQELRTLRMRQQWDPSALATRSCLSLAQLYELEMGGSSLFYSASLRLQAAKKVAALLGTNWDTILAQHQTVAVAAEPVLANTTVPADASAQPSHKLPTKTTRKWQGIALTLLLGFLLVGGCYITDQYLGYQLPLGLTFDRPANSATIPFRVRF